MSPLELILNSVFGTHASDLKTKAFSFLKTRLNAELAKRELHLVAHGILKQIEDAQGPSVPGTVEQRVAVAEALAHDTANAFAAAGASVMSLCAAQASLDRARGTAGEEAARARREGAELAFERAVENIGRAAAGAELK